MTLLTTGHLQSFADPLITIVAHLTMQLIKINTILEFILAAAAAHFCSPGF